MKHLQPTEDLRFPARLAASADRRDGAHLRMDELPAWLRERAGAHEFAVDRIPFRDLTGWGFAAGTGNLAHHSGRFFSVEGLHWECGTNRPPSAYQPIINQPEVGILGILVKEFDGVPHFLMQAKVEPGNPRPLMLSPTVQATRSNYTRVHQGAEVRYLEYFVGARRGRVVVDVLQSEHGDWFLRKRNRNMLVLVDEAVPLHEDFCWLSLAQINELLNQDNVINMDSRTVLACLPQRASGSVVPADHFGRSLAASRDRRAGAVMRTTELLSWFTDMRSLTQIQVTRKALLDLPDWHRGDREIARQDGRHFKVVAVSVTAAGREVTSWSQPLIEPCGRGLAAFLVREFDGVLHVLVHARVEGGFVDTVEIGPTIQAMSEYQLTQEPPPFIDAVPVEAGSPRVRYEAVHAEEGGRFLNAEVRYMIIDAGEDVPDQPPPDYAWATVGQLSELLRHSQYVNVQARTLLACLNAVR